MVFGTTRTPPILFGIGAAQQVGSKVSEFGCKRVIFVTDKGVKAAGVADEIVKNLEAAGVDVVQFDEVASDPPDHMIEACAGLARAEGVDGVVALGGGSVLDTGKCVNVLLNNPSPISRYFGVNQPQQPGKVLVLLPTTSGTGSEVTHIAVVTDTQNHRKVGVLGPNCSATLAIVDPALCAKMPPRLTAATGMDAFSHAAETLTSGLANPISDPLAERAIALAVENLPVAVENGSNMDARLNMCLASTLAGIAFKDGLTHLGHAIAHTLGARYHIHHGVGCAIALPAVIEFVTDAVPARVRMLGRAMGLKIEDAMSDQDVGRRVADGIRSLNKRVGIPTMKELGVEESALDDVAAAVLKDDCALFVPKQITAAAVAAVLRNAYAA